RRLTFERLVAADPGSTEAASLAGELESTEGLNAHLGQAQEHLQRLAEQRVALLDARASDPYVAEIVDSSGLLGLLDAQLETLGEHTSLVVHDLVETHARA